MVRYFQFLLGLFRGEDEDPEQKLEHFEKYLENMDWIFKIKRARNADGARIDFEDDDKKDIILIEGGSEIQDLFTHVGKVSEDNNYELHCNYKGPIEGSWYIHMLIDQYSKFPVMTVHETTGWDSMKSALDKTFTCYGIPKEMTSDRTSPYEG